MSTDQYTASMTIDPASVEESPPFDFTFKLISVGDSGTGKTSFIHKYTEDKFNDNYQATIELDIKYKIIRYQNKHIKLQFWDTVGQERFKTFIASYFRGVVGVLLFYDTTNRTSFDNLISWINLVKSNCWNNAQFILIGTKIDEDGYREVNELECKEMAKKFSIPLVECSSKTGVNIDAAIMFLVKHIFIKIGSVLNADTELLKSVIGVTLMEDSIKFFPKQEKKCQPCLKP